ncbi:hypothetical protein [Streptomyces tsukubensis]|uniref:hypothetical protein n=1 Tax=Streptomyces tsukubensis TaxID=83656 RepID=UPI00344EA21E
MVPELTHVDLVPASNAYVSGFLVVRRLDHAQTFGFVWEHRLADGTTTWVAQPDKASDASRIPGFQSKEWAADFLYEREWPKFVLREDAAAEVLHGRPEAEHPPTPS